MSRSLGARWTLPAKQIYTLQSFTLPDFPNYLLAAGALVEYGLAKIMSNVIARPPTAGGF